MKLKEKTALPPHARSRLEEIGKADILVGIPCYHNESTIVRVIDKVSQGLYRNYGDRRAVLAIVDGGSTDDTRNRAIASPLKPQQEKIVTVHRGMGGKGSALRAIFEIACQLQVSACATVDADLRSINPNWVKSLLEPILEKDYEYVTPLYIRHKYDGTITNNIVCNLTRALYGKRIRQPIGGDFAFSRSLARYYLDRGDWETDIAKFGIDIWMTLNAIVRGAKICQTHLGAKIHDPKDPAESLGPMFRQVCGTLFSQLERDEGFWMSVRGSDPIPTFGTDAGIEPEPISVDLERMVRTFQESLQQFDRIYRELFSDEVFSALHRAGELPPSQFEFPAEIWVKLLYESIARYHQLRNARTQLLDLMVPLYLGRVASFVNQTRDLESREVEAVVEDLASLCEEYKPDLLELWTQKTDGSRLDAVLHTFAKQ